MDEFQRFHDRCPSALDRLSLFNRQLGNERLSYDAALARGAPNRLVFLWQARGVGTVVQTDGLEEAATEALREVQAVLRESGGQLGMDAAQPVWTARVLALTALDYIGGARLAKEVEANVSAGAPLSLCVGSNKKGDGFVGCLHTFPDTPYGRGKHWPRTCPKCRREVTNRRNAARAARLRRLRLIRRSPGTL